MSRRRSLDATVEGKPGLATRLWPGPSRSVLLVHGLAHNLSVWSPLVDLLPDDVEAVALDLRGHGRSDASGSHTYADYCDDVVRTARTLGHGPPLLVGHSWGARVALYAAASYPAAFRGVVALDQALWDYEPPAHYLSGEASAGPPLEAPVLSDAAYREALREAQRWPLWSAVIERRYRRVPDGWVAAPSPEDIRRLTIAEAAAQPVEHLLDRIICPVMAVFAENDEDFAFAPRIGRSANVDGLRNRHPNIRVEWIAGDHGFHVERAGQLARLISAFDQSSD